MLTEQPNPNTQGIDQMTALEIVQTINAEDQTVALAVQNALPDIAAAIEAIVERLMRGGRLIYVGAGTSGRLGVLDAVECVPTFGTPPDLVQGFIAGGEGALVRAVEGAEDQPELAQADLAAINLGEADGVVGIAASGRTPYVLGALTYARQQGAKTIAIACNVPAPILDLAEIAIGVPVGPEVIAGSTRMKAGTAQKMVLNMLSTGSMIQLGKVYGNLMVDVQVTNEKLAGRARHLVMRLAQVDALTAQTLLEKAHNNVKAAVVMHHKSVSYDAALAMLHAFDGHLRQVIGDIELT